jgi:DNA-binding transcriptional regulator YiaG
MKKKYESEALMVIHEDMKSMHRSGFISDEEMREFDELCLVQEGETGEKSAKSPKTEQVTT